MEVGVRELRARLSAYLDEVREGTEIVVTDRGTPIARVVPMGERPFDRLVREGRVARPPRAKRPVTRRPLDVGGPLSDLVVEQRR